MTLWMIGSLLGKLTRILFSSDLKMILSFNWNNFDVDRKTQKITCLCVPPSGILYIVQQITIAQKVFQQSSLAFKLLPTLWNVSVPHNPWTCCSWSILLFFYGPWALLWRSRKRVGSSLLRFWARHTRPVLWNILWETLPVCRSKMALIWDNSLIRSTCGVNDCLACLRCGDESYFPYKHFYMDMEKKKVVHGYVLEAEHTLLCLDVIPAQLLPLPPLVVW